MSKKSIGKAIFVMFALILSACSSEKSTSILEANIKEEKESPTAAEQNWEDREYEIITETFSKENVKVEYPQIIKFKDEGKQQIINELIKKEALTHVLETMQSLERDQKYEAEGKYEIKLKNENILSIAYKSYNNITPSAHPYHLFFTTNIDLTSGNQLFLSDFVSEIDNEFITILKRGKYVGDIGVDFEDEIREQAFSQYNSAEELITALSNRKEERNGIYAYITDNTLGISMPVAHVAGDHAEFEINLYELDSAAFKASEVH